MKKVFIVFDQIPKKEDGGLVATYIEFVNEFNDLYDICFVSVFKSDTTNISEFEDIPVITLVERSIDNRFYRAFVNLKKKRFKKFVFAIKSFFIFFCSIPYARLKSKKMIDRQSYIVASAPASAIFLSKSLSFILEIHSSFDFFWGKNYGGRLQTKLMSKPIITVFRNSIDSRKGNLLFPSTYIYNCFDDRGTKKIEAVPNLTHSAVFVGRLVPEKRPLKLLELAEKVKEYIYDFRLDIYGDGPLKGLLEEEVKKRNLQNVVFLKGFTSDKSIYKKYDVAWLTSSFEGFGLVIIEAMANCVPTVSVEWGEAVWEIIQNNKTGIIAKSEKEFVRATIKILENKEYRDRLSFEARKDYEERFSPRKHKAAWEELFYKVYEQS